MVHPSSKKAFWQLSSWSDQHRAGELRGEKLLPSHSEALPVAQVIFSGGGQIPNNRHGAGSCSYSHMINIFSTGLDSCNSDK